MSKLSKDDEDEKMLDYLEEKTRNASEPVSMLELWKRYANSEKSPKTWSCLDHRFRKFLAPTLYSHAKFSLDSRLRMILPQKRRSRRRF
ncbi:unnamed protein product [Caenorhabditis sp. 36 PRJEB53466]|nr:unnamed protein product [Caenorhabditis sp. 36 PRJEB53466]